MPHNAPQSIGADTVARLRAEGLLSMVQAAALLPARHGKRASSTILRWAQHGKNGAVLEAFPMPNGDWYTSGPALDRFLAASAAKQTGRQLQPTMAEWTDAVLRSRGIRK